jgi:uncharacterized protein YpmS
MTRHEEGEANDKITLTRQELRDEIKKEVKHQARRRVVMTLVLYLVFFALMLGLPFLLLAGVAAKTGLYDVPVLTSWLYDPPAPTRTVVPLAGSNSDDILASMTARASFNEVLGIVELSLSEQELTTLIKQSVADAAEAETLPFPLESVQVALLGDGVMEFYAVTEREGNQAPVLLQVAPHAVNGALELETVDFLIGSFDVPDFMTDMILDAVTSSLTEGLEQGLAVVGGLDDIFVEEEKLRVELSPRIR